MSDFDLRNKRVMIREDLNVPMKNGRIMNDKKILYALPTVETALQKKHV